MRQFFHGTVLLAGAISTGEQVAAACLLGADLVYMGTRFIATRECAATAEYKNMIVTAQSADIIYTPAVSGIPANFMRQSLEQAQIAWDDPASAQGMHLKDMASEARAWKTVWSAGHGVACIHDIPSIPDLVARLRDEYAQAARHLEPWPAPSECV